MEELQRIHELLTLPFQALVILALYVVYKRLNALTDAFISYLQERARNGVPAAQTALDKTGGGAGK